MQVVKTAPRSLQREVRFFYSIQAGPGDHGNRVNRRLPDGTLDLVFTLSGAPRLSLDGSGFSDRPVMALTGLHTGRTFLSTDGSLHEIGAVLQPGFARRFAIPLPEEGNLTIDASLVFGSASKLLLEELQAAEDEPARHRLLEHFLLRRLRPERDLGLTERIAGALRQIHAEQGCICLPELYRSQYMSERNFRRHFNALVGIPPKRYATIVRVKAFCRQYEISPTRFSPILHGLGYTDSAHFHKDFQKIVGVAPGAYFGDINPFGKCFIGLI